MQNKYLLFKTIYKLIFFKVVNFFKISKCKIVIKLMCKINFYKLIFFISEQQFC